MVECISTGAVRAAWLFAALEPYTLARIFLLTLSTDTMTHEPRFLELHPLNILSILFADTELKSGEPEKVKSTDDPDTKVIVVQVRYIK